MHRGIIPGVVIFGNLLMPPAVNGAQGIAAQSVEAQDADRCRKVWRPHCVRYGIPDPNAPVASDGGSSPEPPKPPDPPDVQQASSLIRSGPQAPPYPRPTFDITGFIRAGWPLVVDYQAPATARVILTVRPLYGGDRFRIDLRPSETGERQIAKIALAIPGVGSQDVGIAHYEVEARLQEPGQKKPVNVPVRIFGFGAGPRAVGSVAINSIHYAPTALKRPAGKDKATLRFDYRLVNAFDLVAEELWRDCGGKIFCNFSHPNRPIRALRPGPQRWDWSVSKSTKAGQYHLSVRAWQNCGARFDPALYKQCGDEVAWVVASAGPVFVQK